MSEEEIKAIEYLKIHIIPYTNKNGNIEFLLNEVVLNLIDKLQKENKELKAENRILSVKLAEYFSDNNLCEKGCKYCESEENKG